MQCIASTHMHKWQGLPPLPCAQELLPALCAAVRDSNAAAAVADCAALLGCHVSPGLLLDWLQPRLLEAAGNTRAQADQLLLLAALLRYAGLAGLTAGRLGRALTQHLLPT